MHPAIDRIRQDSTHSTFDTTPATEPTSPAAEPEDNDDTALAEHASEDELRATQLAALEALATGANVSAAARRAGVHRSTIHNWLNRDDTFAAEYNRIRKERKENIQESFFELTSAAVEALRGLLTSENASADVRLRAALAVLEGAGATIPEPIGPTDPNLIAQKRYLDMIKEEMPGMF
jgi:transposase-like protein